MQRRDPINRIHRQTIPISLISDRQLERRINIAFLLVTSNVQIQWTRAIVCQTMDKPRIGVEVEDNRPVIHKDGRPLSVRETVRMVLCIDELKQIHHIHKPNLKMWKKLAEKSGSSQWFMRCNVATGSHDDV